MDTYKQWVKRNAHWLPAIMGLMEVRANTREAGGERKRITSREHREDILSRTNAGHRALTHPDAPALTHTFARARPDDTTPHRAHERGRT